MIPPDDPPRIVKPRKPKSTPRPIVAVTDSKVFLEATGQLLPATWLPHILLTSPSSIIVCQGFGTHLELLRQTYGKQDTFQYRITPRIVDPRNQDDGKAPAPVRILDAVVNFVGFKGVERAGFYKSGKRWTRYHYPIDPVHFVRESIDDLYPDLDRLRALLTFGQQVREFCRVQQLEVKASAGGLAAQLLRDSRFYPEPRRKMPRLINQIARPTLPGNLYRLRADISPRTYNAAYLDISSAHHEMARQITFPNVNDTHAYGRWGETAPSRPFIAVDGPHPILGRAGLFHVRLNVPVVSPREFPLPFMETPGIKDVWVYSNELDLIEELGGTILGIYTAIVSESHDTGLGAYAEWAIQQLQRNPEYKPWLKPTLHATYGILAARPVPFETGYYRAKGKKLERKDYPLGKVWAPVMARQASRPVEAKTVNVIHRGMIEAELRATVLRFARQLTADRHKVLAVYADSLFVEGDQIPILPHPWRLSEQCSNLRFESPTHFTSDQETRLPGVPRNRRAKMIHDRLIRRGILVSSLVPNQQPIRQEDHNGTTQKPRRGSAEPRR